MLRRATAADGGLVSQGKRGALLIPIAKYFEVDCGAGEESVTLTLKLKIPSKVGVPASDPDGASVIPGGGAPDTTDQV